MHVMQYEITLPADYDMGIIRKRVAEKGPLLDDFPGLGLKAYLIRERGDDSPVNQYAPFYVWTTHAGMNSFLLGPGFAGIVRDFGRPEVQHGSGLVHLEGPAHASVPRTAVRRRQPVPEGTALSALAEEAVRETERLAGLDGVVCATLALDPRHWELSQFTLWAHDTPRAVGDHYQVLRLSQPHRAELSGGDLR
ncbi:DUF4865 family protein [Streptomyces scopuliridis]|uniref:DUF4865 domain-containing protein n=1 Tax=Streptomyces scopuliridis RB72 TaxID=1440053 RepID=A0A2T7SPN9_9ACTN|nr:DUF4865 family protein [Streptomyces scopuliridis]PVE04848.1 hypothetical protein Y717_09245 [Streptomyces scopuliridis RB72]